MRSPRVRLDLVLGFSPLPERPLCLGFSRPGLGPLHTCRKGQGGGGCGGSDILSLEGLPPLGGRLGTGGHA